MSQQSYDNVRNWMNQIDQHANPEVAKALIATKSDLPDKKVNPDTARAFAKEHGLVFMETSSLSGLNVQEAFEAVTKEVIGKQNVLLKSSGAAPGDTKTGNRLRSSKGFDGGDDKGSGKKKKCC